jgi:hypothetical protein
MNLVNNNEINELEIIQKVTGLKKQAIECESPWSSSNIDLLSLELNFGLLIINFKSLF